MLSNLQIDLVMRVLLLSFKGLETEALRVNIQRYKLRDRSPFLLLGY